MVTEEEMRLFKGQVITSEKSSYLVTDAEMKQFNNLELPDMIANRKKQLQDERGLKTYPAYDALEDECQISVTSMKKTISGTQRVTRHFLYKFCVGLHMTLEEANKYFSMCGGELNLKTKEDYICIRALEDGDSIYKFIEQFEHYTDKKIALMQRDRK